MLRMRFGSFVWPNNPRTYTISCKRQTAVHKVPMGGFVVQDLGRTATVMKGEGEFFGAYAYSTFLELQAVFQKGGRGTLVHPVWQTAGAKRRGLLRKRLAMKRRTAGGFMSCARGRRSGLSAMLTD